MARRRPNTIHAQVDGDTLIYTSEAQDYDAAVDSFLDACRLKNLSSYTLKYYVNSLKEFVRFLRVVDVERPADITIKGVEDAIMAKLDSGVKPSTVNTNLKAWRTFLRFLHERSFIDTDVASNVKLLRVERRIIPSFTKAQIRSLLNAPDRSTFTGYRDYVLMLLLLDTGARISEVERVCVSDVLFDEGVIKLYGKGRKERYVPFQAALRTALKKYVGVRGALEHDYLFVNIDDSPIKKRTMQENIQKYGEIARIKDVRVSPHTFRHTFAKMYIMNGGDSFSLQKILGHTTQEMVQTYVSLFGVDISKQHAKFSPLEHLFDAD